MVNWTQLTRGGGMPHSESTGAVSRRAEREKERVYVALRTLRVGLRHVEM